MTERGTFAVLVGSEKPAKGFYIKDGKKYLNK